MVIAHPLGQADIGSLRLWKDCSALLHLVCFCLCCGLCKRLAYGVGFCIIWSHENFVVAVFARTQHCDHGCCIAGWNWDYVFDWTILKYQRSNGVDRPITAQAAVAAAAAAAGGGGAGTGGLPHSGDPQQGGSGWPLGLPPNKEGAGGAAAAGATGTLGQLTGGAVAGSRQQR